MDEIELLQRFRDAVPETQSGPKERARSRLTSVIGSPAAAHARRRRGSRRTWIAFAALLLAAVATTSALAWGGRLLDFVAGEPAPPPVRRSFTLDNAARARVLPIFRSSSGANVIVEHAHGVLGIESSVGPVIIWAAPTRRGGVCYVLDIEAHRLSDGRPNGGGGCNPAPLPDAVKLQHGFRMTRVGDGYLRLVEGQVTPDVASVELHYVDGGIEQLPLAEGFFLYEPRANVEATLIIARDAAGRELKRRPVRSQFPLTSRMPEPIGPERVLFQLETAAGHRLTLAIAPAEGGGVCKTIRYRGGVGSSCGRDPRERIESDAISVHPGLWNEAPDRKPLLTLEGVVGAEVAELELRYENGEVEELSIVEQHVLFEIPPGHHGDRRFLLVARDETGHVLVRQTVN